MRRPPLPAGVGQNFQRGSAIQRTKLRNEDERAEYAITARQLLRITPRRRRFFLFLVRKRKKERNGGIRGWTIAKKANVAGLSKLPLNQRRKREGGRKTTGIVKRGERRGTSFAGTMRLFYLRDIEIGNITPRGNKTAGRKGSRGNGVSETSVACNELPFRMVFAFLLTTHGMRILGIVSSYG